MSTMDQLVHPSLVMTLFNIESKDRQWLTRWLFSNLVCVTVLGCLLVLLRFESTTPVIPMTQATADTLTAVTEVGSIPPQGWRRTANGWEHTSHWRSRSSRPLAELILIQRDREPAWAQKGLHVLRELPPLTYAMFQLTAIAAIVWVAESRTRTGHATDSHC